MHHSIKDTGLSLINSRKTLHTTKLKIPTFGRIGDTADKELAVGRVVVVPTATLVTSLIIMVIAAVVA
jgi:hypothetical protein